MPDQSVSNPEGSPKRATSKEESIDSFIRQSSDAFENWLSSRENPSSLDMSPLALRTLIPKRLYELVHDPNKLKVIEVIKRDDYINLIFAEADRPSGKPVIQTDEDKEFHEDYEHWIKQGYLTATDYPLLMVAISSRGQSLRIGRFSDRSEFRGKGVAKDFYANLANLARAMGFRFIWGLNTERSLNFFIEKQGRSRIQEIDDNIVDEMNPPPGEELEYATVQFLYPEDKVKYLKHDN